MASELAIKRSECIDILHTVCIKLKYFATEEDAQFLIIYKRILHILNGILRLDDLTLEHYHAIYLCYKTPWDQDALSRELLMLMSIQLPVLLSNNEENVKKIRKCFGEEITNSIIEEINMLLELS